MKVTLKQKMVGALAVLLFATPAMAAPTDPFLQIKNILVGWITGSLGTMIAVIGLIVGGFAGVMGSLKVSIMAFGLAIIVAFGPSIIDTIFTVAAG